MEDKKQEPGTITSPVFKDRRYLDPAHTPRALMHREKQRADLATYISPALQGSPPSGTALYGYPGTGKTSVVMRLLAEVEERTRNYIRPFRAIYLNCNLVNSIGQVLQNILALWGDAVSQPGLSLAVLAERTKRRLQDERWVYIIVLDEADRLGKELDPVVYELLEMNQKMGESRIAVMCISNNLGFLNLLEDRSKSRYEPKSIYFPPYTTEELVDILQDRAEKAFQTGALEPDALVLCAAYASKDRGDARRAIDLLRTAGAIAESKGTKITREVVSQAAGKVEQADLQDVLRTLPEHPKYLLIALAKDMQKHKVTGWPSTGEVYALYKAECTGNNEKENTPRQVHNYLKDLEALGILVLEVKHYGQGGKTSAIRFGVDLSELVEPLGLA